MSLLFPALQAIVDASRFDDLIGVEEGQHLDAKSQPYQFASGMVARREVAKDVAAFANAAGGYILIGLTTERSIVLAVETITALRPIPRTMFDPDQYRKILGEWLYPQPKGLVVIWTQCGPDSDHGIGIICIPPQDAAAKPFLIMRTIEDNKKSTEILLGYVERHVDATSVRSVVDLHQALRVGLNIERELLGRISNLEAQIERHFTATNDAQTAPERERALNERRARITQHPSLQDTRILLIAVAPKQATELRSIFSNQPTSIRRALDNPPELRSRGWGINTGGSARFIDGNFLRSDSYREVIDLYRDGTLIVAARIDRENLAWADQNDARIHPLALIEFVTNTLLFYQLVIDDCRVAPQTLELQLVLNHLDYGGKPTLLPSGPVNNLGWAVGSKEAPGTLLFRTMTISATPFEPATVAFQLLREIYV